MSFLLKNRLEKTHVDFLNVFLPSCLFCSNQLRKFWLIFLNSELFQLCEYLVLCLGFPFSAPPTETGGSTDIWFSADWFSLILLPDHRPVLPVVQYLKQSRLLAVYGRKTRKILLSSYGFSISIFIFPCNSNLCTTQMFDDAIFLNRVSHIVMEFSTRLWSHLYIFILVLLKKNITQGCQ